MFEEGFLGTRAPFFMDFVLIIVSLLPLLMATAIALAKNGKYKLHERMQITIFIVAVIVVGYFEYGVRLVGGYDAFMQGSSVSSSYALSVLILHIFIAVVTLGIWSSTIYNAKFNKIYGSTHKRAGIRSFIGITLTSITGIWVYLLLFIY